MYLYVEREWPKKETLFVVQLEFVDDFPEDDEELVRRLLDPLLRLVSRDLSRIKLAISNDIPGEASIRVSRRYHIANVLLGHIFFTKDRQEQTEILIHELMHVLVDVVSKNTSQMLDAYFEEGSSERIFMESRIEEAEEKLTDALALAFYDILKELEETKISWTQPYVD